MHENESLNGTTFRAHKPSINTRVHLGLSQGEWHQLRTHNISSCSLAFSLYLVLLLMLSLSLLVVSFVYSSVTVCSPSPSCHHVWLRQQLKPSNDSLITTSTRKWNPSWIITRASKWHIQQPPTRWALCQHLAQPLPLPIRISSNLASAYPTSSTAGGRIFTAPSIKFGLSSVYNPKVMLVISLGSTSLAPFFLDRDKHGLRHWSRPHPHS